MFGMFGMFGMPLDEGWMSRSRSSTALVKAGLVVGEKTEIFCSNRMNVVGRDETFHEGMNEEDGFQ